MTVRRAIGLALSAGLVACLAACLAASPLQAQRGGKPAEKIVTLDLPGRSLVFRAASESVALRNADGRVDGEAGLLSFTREVSGAPRPVTFVIGGGPGTSSAYLNLGALGPWRIAFGAGGPARPLLPNGETWLDFTDLVFVDPPGTGQGIVLSREAAAKARLWSVEGDIDAISDAIASWLRRHGRLAAPKILAGQSYGGFRVPRLADNLHRRHGVAASGLILVSPILDYGWRYHARVSPLSFATLLPSFAAARMESEGGGFDAHKLSAVEDYARTGFIDDYLKGLRDSAALARIVDRVSAITGLRREVVEAAQGRVDENLFAREIERAGGKVASSYDPSVNGDDPDPSTPRPDHADPFLAALKAPLTTAMTELMKAHVGGSQRPHAVSNEAVFENWQWTSDHGLPESVTALRKMLALDPALRVLIVHGYSDLQTPYFETSLILNQLPDFGGRIAQRNYRGGHMFYSRDESRAALRSDAQALIAGVVGQP